MTKHDPVAAQIMAAARKIAKTQVGWRRHLHQYPELSNREFKTTAWLKDQLTGMRLALLPLKMKTGVLAELRGKKGGPVVAIRSDIDALPIVERSGVPYESKHPGCMHACGHDVHMATVLGAAAVLSELRDLLPGTVRFVFQPAEEMPPGGARPMIAAGALRGVSMIFGLHVDPHLSTGRISLRDGATMASVFDFDLIIRGRGGHAARPHAAVDAIVVAAEIVTSIQTIVSREIDPVEPIAVTFGEIGGGTARNVIAEEVRLVGTARSLSTTAFKRLPALIGRTAKGICQARGATFELRPVAEYPVLSNHPRANRILARSFEGMFGKGKLEETPRVLGGEDFACYLEHVPGAMFRLGTMNKKIKADKPWHSPEFAVDEAAMPVGTAVLAASALDAIGGTR
ncbi:MAG: amidohydrolase [candidate division Zixibacteria bacterium]|jgi:amidohydrolase|nr:amidohydrolase [candidate division Zixibacteria bacterium]